MRQTTGIIILEFLTGSVLFIGMLLGLIAWRLVSGPTDLGFLKSDIESALTDARDGRKVEIGEVSLLWLNEETKFQVIADQLTFYGENDEEVGSAERALIDLNAVTLLSGKAELSVLVLEKGELHIRRNLDGIIRIADQTLPAVYPLHFHEASTPLQYVEQSLLNIVDNATQSDAVERLQRVSLRDFSVSLVDEGLDVFWEVDNANLDIRKEAGTLVLEARGDVFGEGAPEQTTLNARLDLGTRSFSAAISFLRQSLPEFPLLQLAPVEISGRLPSDITIQFDMDAYGIQQTAISVVTNGGEIKVAGSDYPLRGADFTIYYDVPQNSVELDVRELDAEKFRGAFLVTLPAFNSWIETPIREKHVVKFKAIGFDVDLTSVFPSSWSLQDIELNGEVDLARKALTFSDLRFGVEDAAFNASGEVYLKENGANGSLPIGIQLTGKSEGSLSPSLVLDYWPEKLGEGARKWVSENIRTGIISNAEFDVDIQPDSFANGYLNDEALQVDFAFGDASVGFLSDLPLISNGMGQARLNGNSFSLDVESAVFSKWEIYSATVQIPRFVPKGDNLIVDAKGRGKVRDIVQTLSDSRLQLSAQYGLDVNAISGDGDAHFSLRRPLLSDVSYDDTRFSVDGQIRSGGFQNTFAGLDLSRGNAAVKVNNDIIQITGYGELEDTPVQFEWTDRFRSEGMDRTTLQAKGSITPDLLNQFGLSVRAYLTGNVAVDVNASGPSLQKLRTVLVDFDLTENRLDLSEFDWVKPSGQAAKGKLSIKQVGPDQTVYAFLTADGFEFRGDIKSGENGQVNGVTLQRFFLKDQMDLRGELKKTNSNGLQINVSGPYLNAAPFMDGLLPSGGGGAPVFGNVSFDAKIDRLDLKENYSLQEVDLAIELAGPELKSMQLAGRSVGQAQMQMSLSGEDRKLSAYFEDAGGLLSGIFGFDFVTGGELNVEGTLGNAGEPAKLLLTVADARLKQAPLLTQILSLASLRGLADVMSGEGVLFTTVRMPLTIDERGFYLEGVKASGPAMGITANGHILDEGENIALDGVLVPSFGVNSALGGIPIFGDLFVSREGEGVFAITYNVRGSVSEARVTVNPLSGLLPGVLRRIFENPAEPIPTLEEAETQNNPAE